MPSGIPVTGKRAPRGSRSTEGTFYVVKSAQRRGGKLIKQKVVVIPRCKHPGCEKGAVSGGLPGLCISHGGGRRCQFEGCPKSAAGPTHFCVAHGGGKRCAFEGCTRQPNRGGFCGNHGVARCKYPNCTKVEKGGGYCCKHGGGRRCAFEGCSKHNVGGGFCIAHGGGKRCSFEGCSRQDVGGGFCRIHGGGFRCEEPECNKFSLSAEKYCRAHLKARNLIDAMLTAAMDDPEDMADPSSSDGAAAVGTDSEACSTDNNNSVNLSIENTSDTDIERQWGGTVPEKLALTAENRANVLSSTVCGSVIGASTDSSTTGSILAASLGSSRDTEPQDGDAVSDMCSLNSVPGTLTKVELASTKTHPVADKLLIDSKTTSAPVDGEQSQVKLKEEPTESSAVAMLLHHSMTR